jgi:hypothetical protein
MSADCTWRETLRRFPAPFRRGIPGTRSPVRPRSAMTEHWPSRRCATCDLHASVFSVPPAKRVVKILQPSFSVLFRRSRGGRKAPRLRPPAPSDQDVNGIEPHPPISVYSCASVVQSSANEPSDRSLLRAERRTSGGRLWRRGFGLCCCSRPGIRKEPQDSRRRLRHRARLEAPVESNAPRLRIRHCVRGGREPLLLPHEDAQKHPVGISPLDRLDGDLVEFSSR